MQRLFGANKMDDKSYNECMKRIKNLILFFKIYTLTNIYVYIMLNIDVKAKLFCPEIAGLFCRIAGLFCHDSRANLSLKPVCFGIAIS